MVETETRQTACCNPRCLGNYDFGSIARFARKRFVDGVDTITLLNQAQTPREKEEIALVCLLDVEDAVVKDIRLDCRHARECPTTDCRQRLRKMIENDLADRPAGWSGLHS
jgi:hypothetical protein